jgi:hypothetical protein
MGTSGRVRSLTIAALGCSRTLISQMRCLPMAFSAAVQGHEFGIFHRQLPEMVHPPFAYVEVLNSHLV